MGLGRLSFARLRPAHIAALSVGYWIGLAAVKLGGLIVAIARVGLPGMHGNVGAQLNNFVALHLTVSSSSGSVIWEGRTSLPVMLAWIVGPPLILALTARWAREVEDGEEVAGTASIDGGGAAQLGAPRPEWQAGADRGTEAERRRKRLDGRR